MKDIFYLFLLITFLFACNKKADEPVALEFGAGGVDLNESLSDNNLRTVRFVPPSVKTDEEVNNRVEAAEKKIIRNANIKFQVKNNVKAQEGIRNIVKRFYGYISTSEESKSSYSWNNNMTIRVSAEKFDLFIDELLKEAIFVDEKNITSEDVTTQFIDTEARLKAKKEVEKRYLELLGQAKKVEEIIQIEEKLGEIREEIEAKEGVLKYLNDQVLYSTIKLEFYETVEGKTAPDNSFGMKIIRGIKNGWDMMLEFIVNIFNVWPFIIIALLFLFFWKRWRNKRKKMKV